MHPLTSIDTDEKARAIVRAGIADPDDFVPERFLEKSEKSKEEGEVVDPGVWAFGYGRRCVTSLLC